MYTVDIKILVCVSWRMNCGEFVYSQWFDTDTLATNVCISYVTHTPCPVGKYAVHILQLLLCCLDTAQYVIYTI